MKRIILLLALAAPVTAVPGAEPDILLPNHLIQQSKDLLRQVAEATDPGASTARRDQIASAREARTAEAGSDGTRDPFAMTAIMLQGGGGFQGGSGEISKLPALRLRGLGRHSGEPGMALIEVEGSGIYLLRVGEVVTIRGDRDPLTLRLKRIHSASIEVESGTDQRVVVR